MVRGTYFRDDSYLVCVIICRMSKLKLQVNVKLLSIERNEVIQNMVSELHCIIDSPIAMPLKDMLNAFYISNLSGSFVKDILLINFVRVTSACGLNSLYDLYCAWFFLLLFAMEALDLSGWLFALALFCLWSIELFISSCLVWYTIDLHGIGNPMFSYLECMSLNAYDTEGYRRTCFKLFVRFYY